MQTKNTFRNDCIIYNLVVGLVLLFSTAVANAQNIAYGQSQTTQIIVKHKQNLTTQSPQVLTALTVASGLKVKQSISFSPQTGPPGSQHQSAASNVSSSTVFSVIEIVDKTIPIEQAIKQLRDSGLYEYVEPDYPIELDLVANDPLLPSQWGLESGSLTATDPDINAYQAWNVTTGISDVVIAVVDSGVDYTHPDLVDNIWVNTGEIPGDGLDNDGNGVVDDVHGLDAANQDGDPLDNRGHGTHVAGILAAKGDNALGISGSGWVFKIMPVQIFNAQGNGSTSDAIYGLSYVHMMKTQYGVNVKITNNSWGGGSFSQALKDTIMLLAEDEIMFVTSSGNDAVDNDYKPYYPSAYGIENIITVGAVGPDTGNTFEQMHRPTFSNTGFTSVDLAAPGVDIISTKMENGLACQADSGVILYSLCSGTSMAVPFVSATLGLLASVYPNDNLFINRQKIIRSVGFSPQSVERSWDDQNQQWSRTGGILKADKALAYDGFTIKEDFLNAVAIRNIKQPQVQTFDKSISLSAIKSQGINWVSQTDVDWLTTTNSTGIVSNTLTDNVAVEITTNNQQTGIYRGQVGFSDVSAVVEEVSVPVRLTIKTEPEQTSPQVLSRPNIINNSKQFGNALAVENNQAFIAETAQTGGAVHLYQYFDKFWVYTDSLDSPEPNKLSAFGSALAIDNGTLIVGAELDDTNATFAGAVYVYEKTANQWQQTQKIVPTGDAFKFGNRIAINNDNLAIMGARNVFLYQKIQGQWTEVQTISTVNNTINTNFDGDIALQGNFLVITNPAEQNADLYQFGNNNWQLVTSLIDNSAFDFYLGDIDFNNGRILITSKPPSTSNEPNIEALGSISFRIYKNNNGTWDYEQYDIPSGRDGVGFVFPDPNLNIRDSVILSDNDVFVSSVYDHHFENGNSGAMYRYTKTQNGYELAGKFVPDLNSNSSSFDFGFGASMAVSGQRILVSGAGSNAHDAHIEAFDFTSIGRLQSLVLNQIDDQWQQVTVSRFYESMIPVCSVGYVNNTSPVVIRIKKIESSSFEIKLQNPGNLDAVVADTVYCIIAEEGAWILPNGSMFEAKKYRSTLTAVRDNWGENTDYRSYDNQFDNPVVLGQVISNNDSDWSVFWSRGSETSSDVDNLVLRTGKHAGEDLNQQRNDETVGYMVFESGLSKIGSVNYQAEITGPVIQDLYAVDNPVLIGFQEKPRFAVVSQSGIDGGNGSWPVLKGSDALSAGELIIAVDEDQIYDSERNHINESVGYFTASSHLDISLQPAPVRIRPQEY